MMQATFKAGSGSTLDARHRSALGAREAYASVMKQLRWNGESYDLQQLSPSTLQRGDSIGIIPQTLIHDGRELRLGSFNGDHIALLATYVDVAETQVWHLAEFAEHSGHLLRVEQPSLPGWPPAGGSLLSWRVGASADIVWIAARWWISPEPGPLRVRLYGLDPTTWEVMRDSLTPVVVSDIWSIVNLHGTPDFLVYGTNGGLGRGSGPRLGLLDTQTFEVIRERACPDSAAVANDNTRLIGVGGNEDRVWAAVLRQRPLEPWSRIRIYEFDPADLSIRRFEEWPERLSGGDSFRALAAN